MWAVGRYDLRLSEAEFWSLTPYEFGLLLERHRVDGLWRESMAAVQPMLYAEAHRDPKKRTTTYTLEEMTITGLAKAAQRAAQARLRAEQADPAELWAKISGIMSACGGK